MTSTHEAERSEMRASATQSQRERERERRRLRDRQRRQNMSQEQREKHLARRRRNYQLRRIRAHHSKFLLSHQTHSTIIIGTDHKINIAPQLQLPSISTTTTHDGAQKVRHFPRRLRLTDIRHLARRLHSDHGRNQTGADTTKFTITISCISTKRLRLTYVKRLARSLKVNAE